MNENGAKLKHRALLWRGIFIAALSVQVCSLCYYFVFFERHGFLPSPFLYDKSDTFMDLYNTLWWAGDDGRYTVWGSVYPPLNFLLLKALRIVFYQDIQLATPSDFRSLNLAPAYLLCIVHIIAPFVVVSFPAWRVISRPARLAVATIAAMSAPLLFSMERGNLIIICLLFLPLAFQEKSNFRTLAIALLINIKPYFAVLLIGYIIAGDFRRFLQATAFAGAIFLFTGLALDPDFPLFLLNLVSFSQNEAVFSGREVLALPSSISAFSYTLTTLLRDSNNAAIYAQGLVQMISLIELAKAAAILCAVALIIAARRRLTERQIMATLIIIVINAGVWVGGYSQIFYLACVPAFLSFRLLFPVVAAIGLILMPLDLATLMIDPLGPSWALLSGHIINNVWQLGLGTFVRPLLNFTLLLLVSLECIVRLSEQTRSNFAHTRIQYS